MTDHRAPFRILPAGHGRRLLAPLAHVTERVLGLRRLADLHDLVGAQPDVERYVRRCLEVLDVECELPDGDLERIPRTGRVVVVANHPFGALEGLLIVHLLRAVRPDVRVLANHVLGRFPQLAPALIAVDPFGGDAATRRNGRPLKDAVRWLEDDHALVVFPAGEVAHRRFGEVSATDPDWNPIVGRIVRRTGSPVLPVFFAGSNGRRFDVAGWIHPLLRTLLLPRALLDKRGGTVRMRVGKLVEAASTGRFTDDRECVDYLRLRTLVLGRSLEGARRERGVRRLVRALRRRVEPIAAATDPQLLAADVAALPPAAHLLSGGRFDVLIAAAPAIPSVLREIGRLRERTFRAVGEGTGRALDLDRHDDDYLHLFLWDPERREVAGAYRLGLVDELLARGGAPAIYSTSLFHMEAAFLRHVTPGIELGRSWVRAEHQRGFLPLLLLWRGIATFAARHPRYRRLFGPVSISAAHDTVSRVLMVDHLSAHESSPELAALVRPRRPLRADDVRRSGLRWTPAMLRDLGDVAAMVTEMERDTKGVPVLIREYLKLGGKLVAFNVDRSFADVVDGLVLVDLDETDARVLARYMGRDAVARFRSARAPAIA